MTSNKRDIAELSKAGDVSAPTKDNTKNTFTIRCPYYFKPGCNSVRKQSAGYSTAEEAQLDTDLFRFAVNKNGAKDWQQPTSRRKNGLSDEQKCYMSDFEQSSHVAVRSLGDLILNCAQKSKLKTIKKLHEMSRLDFSYHFDTKVFTEDQIATYMTSLTRVKRLPPSSFFGAKFDAVAKQKIIDLRKRCILLDAQIKADQRVKNILCHRFDKFMCHRYLLREGLPAAENKREMFTDKQNLKVTIQVDMMRAIYNQLINKSIFELVKTQQFVGSFCATTSALEFENFAVEIASHRKQFCVPVLINNYLTMQDSPRGVLGSTVYRWYTQFTKSNGFWEDKRGLHSKFGCLDIWARLKVGDRYCTNEESGKME